MAITDVVAGIRSRVKNIDEKLAEEAANAMQTLSEDIDDIPLKGIIPSAMRAIEEKGLTIAKARLAEIQAEIRRLEIEAKNTSAIISAGVAKIEILAKHEKEMSAPAPTDAEN